jgi:hypothetical protein
MLVTHAISLRESWIESRERTESLPPVIKSVAALCLTGTLYLAGSSSETWKTYPKIEGIDDGTVIDEAQLYKDFARWHATQPNETNGGSSAQYLAESPTVIVREDKASRLRQLQNDRPGSTVRSAEGTRFAYTEPPSES